MDVAPAVGAVAPGLVFITPNNGLAPDGLLATDNAGRPVWIRPDTGSYAANFRPAVYQGKPVLTWWEGAVNGGYGSGQLVIVDATYTEVLRFGAGNGRKADIHEFQITPQGTALILTDAGVADSRRREPAALAELGLHRRRGRHRDRCRALRMAQRRSHRRRRVGPARARGHGEPGSDGDVRRGPDAGSTIAAPAIPVYDSVHANGIELDTDGHLLVSARNTSAIYKVDRSTGAIIWRLGGKKSDFKMGDGATFGLQHDPRRHADGTLSVFDDGTTGPSRGIVLNVDEVAMTASLVKAYPHPHGKFAMSQGNMEVLPNGNVFVGWGSTGYASEFTTDGQLLFDADFSGSIQSYRCFRYPWTAQPAEPPVIALDAPGNGSINVYASWNGATQVASWEVLNGSSATQLASLGSFPRTDFETVLVVKPTSSYIAVNALDAQGAVLGTSKAMTIPD